MCNCLTIQKRRIGSIILLLIPLVLLAAGCATPYARTWQSQLWKVPETNEAELAELGQLKTEGNTFSLICTEFREAGNPSNALIGIGISCRNDTNETLALQYDPIQVIDGSLTITKPLSIRHVMYRLYGGDLREDAQLSRLAQKPLTSSGDSFLDVLVGVINAYRSYERGAIITELHKKEALPYNLYYRSFTPTSLPPGVSTAWMAYYPGTTDTITVILQGLKVEEGVVFSKPPPPLPPPSSEDGIHPAVAIIFVGFTAMALYFMMVQGN
jgi:hypothetical protein